jgi:hypothetical protein
MSFNNQEFSFVPLNSVNVFLTYKIIISTDTNPYTHTQPDTMINTFIQEEACSPSAGSEPEVYSGVWPGTGAPGDMD